MQTDDPRDQAPAAREASAYPAYTCPSADVTTPMDEPQPPADSAGLNAALEAGDKGAVMEILVMQYGDDVYRYCRRMLGNVAECDDVSQTVFVQAFQCFSDLIRVRHHRAWLLTIARNRCVDRLRAMGRCPQALELGELCAVIDRDPIKPEDGDDPRVLHALDDCLDRLDRRSREVLILRYFDGLSYPEIGAQVNDTAGALRIRLLRALSALRRCLERKGVRR